MGNIFYQTPIYNFLYYCNHKSVEKTVLDCGAGGQLPPLAIFKEHGFVTKGIDISEQSIKYANEFEKKNRTDLNIELGDIRELHFKDSMFGAVYSYDTIFHLRKNDIEKSIKEMYRVLKAEGLLYLNVLHVDENTKIIGLDSGNNEILLDNDKDMLHSFFTTYELDGLFEELNLRILRKEIRTKTIPFSNSLNPVSYIDYILEK